LALACDGQQSAAPPATRSRVDAVLATGQQGQSMDAFCEVSSPAGSAKRVSWPQLDGAMPAAGGGWTWDSLWATWCAPCLAEMPLLEKWEKSLNDEGLAISLRHVSVDAGAQDLARFRAQHADAPKGPRVADQAAVAPWLVGLGLDEGAAIPIHLFSDPQGRLRCVRVGAVSEPDYATVERMLRQG